MTITLPTPDKMPQKLLDRLNGSALDKMRIIYKDIDTYIDLVRSR